MKKTIIASAFLLAFTITAFGQNAAQPRPDRWRGLIIDESTPEDAIRILGKADKDEMGTLKFPPMKDQLTEKRKQKVFRNLLFNKVDDFDRAKIIFYEDKLVGIALDFKEKLLPAALVNAYNIRFGPVVSSITEAFSSRDDMRREQGNLSIDRYPPTYYLVGFSENTIVAAWISNTSVGRALSQGILGNRDQPGTYPGKVEQLILLSRTLENRDKVDLLK